MIRLLYSDSHAQKGSTSKEASEPRLQQLILRFYDTQILRALRRAISSSLCLFPVQRWKTEEAPHWLIREQEDEHTNGRCVIIQFEGQMTEVFYQSEDPLSSIRKTCAHAVCNVSFISSLSSWEATTEAKEFSNVPWKRIQTTIHVLHVLSHVV
jgi:hypothetical protein